MSLAETMHVFRQLEPGDFVELKHEAKVGYNRWNTIIKGTLVNKERRRHGLHRRRSSDVKVFSDVINLGLEDGELTTGDPGRVL